MTISLNSTQLENLKRAVRVGLKAFERPEPMTLVEWADENFYLSSESSYIEGRWQTLPFQKAMMNAIGHREIQPPCGINRQRSMMPRISGTR